MLKMLYEESLDGYAHVENEEIIPTTSNHVEQGLEVDGDDELVMNESHHYPSSFMDNEVGDEDYELITTEEDGDEQNHHHQGIVSVQNHNESEEVLEGTIEMEEMEEVIDESGRRMLLRADGHIMYHPDDLLVLDDDGTTMTWKVELVDQSGNSHNDISTVPPIDLVHPSPITFDVSAYEVCQSGPSTSHGSIPSMRRTRVRQSIRYGREMKPVMEERRFARLDRLPPPAPNPRHSRIHRRMIREDMIVSSESIPSPSPSPSYQLYESHNSSCSLSNHNHSIPPIRPPRIPRRPTAKYATQASLAHSTQGLETANCNYCHLRFYMPRCALRSRITYGEGGSRLDLPQAFFECPICGMESASGPNRNNRR